MTTRRELVEIDQPYSNHNGGNLVFGPDGKLYIGMGDGGARAIRSATGRTRRRCSAKILRFDVDAAKPAPEIVHLGVRNPWRFSFDAKTGDLYIGDVGQNLWEYVYVVAAATTRRTTSAGTSSRAATASTPKHVRQESALHAARSSSTPHDEGCSITGGVVYRGKALPELDGRYFYADYCTGLLRSFVWTTTARRRRRRASCASTGTGSQRSTAGRCSRRSARSASITTARSTS